MNTVWRELILVEMAEHDETWLDVEAVAGSEHIDVPFNHGFSGKPFTVWTSRRVYFPATYDHSEWCASVSRNPDGVATDPVGGGSE